MLRSRMTQTAVAGLAIAVLAGGVTAGAAADDARGPSRQDVQDARDAVTRGKRDVAQVRADLAAAEDRLRSAADAASAAGEAYNGARWRLQQARRAAAKAQVRSAAAAVAVEQLRAGVQASVSAAYENSPALDTLAALTRADGIDGVLSDLTTLDSAQEALGQSWVEYRRAAARAAAASARADATRQDAADAAVAAKQARDDAAAAAASAQAEATRIAERKTELIAELAHLEHVSVRIAAKRQAALEEARRLAAEKAAQEAAEKAAQEAAAQAAAAAAAAAQSQAGTGGSDPAPPAPAPTPAPPTSGGVAAALAFARDQIGEPYVWGAAGPNAWDCSGLTMGAWRAGGISLPHYSAAQYQVSTPIGLDDLRPGDLVFWATSSDPSTIHHVAIYAGDGMIIQAPRTGRDVDEESMYAWEPPTFFARP